MNTNTSKSNTQNKVLNIVALILGLTIFILAWMRENGFLPILLAAIGCIMAIVNLLKFRKAEPKTTLSFIALIFSVAACSVFSMALSTEQTKTNTEEVKQVMPSELKDTTVLKQEEESALDKLNSITDTLSGK